MEEAHTDWYRDYDRRCRTEYLVFPLRPKPTDLQLSGRIEGYQTDIGAMIGGRVDCIAVREGDQVKPGQVIARLNDNEVQAQLRGAEAQLSAAQQQERQARLQIQVIESQIQQAQLTLEQSEVDQQGRIFQAQATVAAAEAQLKQAEAQLNLARVDRDRFAQLVQDGAVTRQQFDQVQANYETAQAVVEANQKQVDAARGGLTLAQTSSFNPGIRNAQVSALLQQQQQAYAQLKAAQAEVKNTQAAIQQIQAQIAYLNIASPIDGVVTARSVEPGAVVSNGRTLVDAAGQNRLYTFDIVHSSNSRYVGVQILSAIARSQPSPVVNNLNITPDKIQIGLSIAIMRGYTSIDDPVVAKVRQLLHLMQTKNMTASEAAYSVGLSLNVVAALGRLS